MTWKIQALRELISSEDWERALAIRREAQMTNHAPDEVDAYFVAALKLGVKRQRLLGTQEES